MSTHPNDEMLATIKGPRGRTPSETAERLSAVIEPDAERAQGRRFAEAIKKESRMPIIALGPPAAGKTTLLAALFRTQPSLNVRWSFESALFARDCPLGALIAPEIKHLREIDVSNWVDHPVRATRFGMPFFLPLELIPRRSKLLPAKLAYLESRGEFYKPVSLRDPDSGREFYVSQPFPELLAEFLRCYERPIIFIHVAPCEDACRNNAAADKAVLFALENYQSVRRDAHAKLDSHLFLATKWDRVACDIGLDAYLCPPADALESVLRQQFRESWLKFQSMQRENAGISHAYMQYIGTANADPKYANTVLNWIVRGIHQCDLFPAVVPPPPPGWMDHVRNFVGL